jgi:hypothetical protein
MPRTPKSQTVPAPAAASREWTQIKVTIREPDGLEAKFVNHVAANFNGTEFVVTLAQAVPPVQREGAAWETWLANGELEARVVAQVAMPLDKFVEMSAAFATLVLSLRERNLLPPGGESTDDEA